jgi:hypothetical protein
MGTLDTDKAKVSGAEVTEQDQSTLDKILKKMEEDQTEADAFTNLVNVELSNEIVGTLRGHFSQNLIYNIPRFSGNGAKTHRECDLMKNPCPFKGKKPHVHIVGVGYQGALTALRAYGRMSATVEDMPEIVEQGDKLYWAAYGEAVDRHTGNDIGRWYLEPVLRKSGNKFIENEHGASIAQSKALRNVVLALIPAKLMEGWIEDYKSGKQAFDVQRAKDMGYGPEKQQEKTKERRAKTEKERTVKSPGQNDLAGVIDELAEQLSVYAPDLEAYYQEQEWTPGKAMLHFTKALNEEAELNKLSGDLDRWITSRTPDVPEMEIEEGADEKEPALPGAGLT